MMDEPIPAWAVELTRQVTILNERLPTHVEWTERNIKDHEVRIRLLERETPDPAEEAKRRESVEARLRQVERFIWVAMGLAAALGGGVGSAVTRIIP